MAKPKIYISSTFFDLQEHRQALITALQKTERFDVVCMENYGTRSTPPLKKCLEDVEVSEFYILLLGTRYGYMPPGEKYSITNLEYKQAIGDKNMDTVGSTPNTDKCVLPFIMDENYLLSDTLKSRINAEDIEDGAELSQLKKEKLAALKKQIRTDFTLERTSFTTADDLTTKVFGALIPELIDRNHAEVVTKLLLSSALAYRCNRERVRNDFLAENFYNKNFYRVYIIHGDKAELPIIFSNNISTYDLSVRDNALTCNIDEYNSNFPDKFVTTLTRDLYYNVFKTWPDNPAISLKELADKLIADERFTNVVFKFDMYYSSWKEKYKKFLLLFFAKLNEANTNVSTSKNFYLLINIKYLTTKEKLKEIPPAAIALERLTKINITHIEQWVRTYFFINTSGKTEFANRAEKMAQRISDHYFPDYAGKDFCMQDAIDKLEVIISDFNNNKNLFENYNKLFQ
ncbi:MAG: DUF4062 domain-containing protein [Ferruginibacter sp.]